MKTPAAVLRGLLAFWLAVLLPSCGGGNGHELTVVASVYPLAFAAEEVGGDGVEVIDLTPPGSEAHDVELSFRDRAAVESADLVVYLGDIGFQPQIERAVLDATGEVVAVAESGKAAPPRSRSAETPLLRLPDSDPHIWLDPVRFTEAVTRVADGYAQIDQARAGGYRARAASLHSRLQSLDERYRETLAGCASRTLLVTHEAFGYLGDRYGLEQVGLSGVSPEGEPTAQPLINAQRLAEFGNVQAIFYEETEEGRRIADAAAEDLGVRAVPLATLESRPSDGDYLAAMQANLISLAKGLKCG